MAACGRAFLFYSIKNLHVNFMLHITGFSDAQIPSLTGTFVSSALANGLKVTKRKTI